MIRSIRMYLRNVGFSGLLYAIKGKLTNSLVFYELKRQEYSYPFRLRIPSTDVWAYEKVIIKKEYDFLVETEPKVIVDAGANIGLASIYFASKYPGAKILAIEPEQSNFELLKRNVEPYSNVYPVNAALWNRNKEINVIDTGLGKTGFMTEEQDFSENLASGISHTVRAITIETIIDDYELDKINILKCDIEGAEKEVFDDTSSWIEKVDSIIVELHERKKTGCSRSFYCGSNGFSNEWKQGENVYLSRGNCLTRRPT